MAQENPGLPDPPELPEDEIPQASHRAGYMGRLVYQVSDAFYLDGVESCCSYDACCPHYCFCPPRNQFEREQIEQNQLELNDILAKVEAEYYEKFPVDFNDPKPEN